MQIVIKPKKNVVRPSNCGVHKNESTKIKA